MVYKFVTRNTVEERVLQRAKEKMLLDHAFVENIEADLNEGDLRSMVTFGAKVTDTFSSCRIHSAVMLMARASSTTPLSLVPMMTSNWRIC